MSSVSSLLVGRWTSRCCLHGVRWGRGCAASLCFLEHPLCPLFWTTHWAVAQPCVGGLGPVSFLYHFCWCLASASCCCVCGHAVISLPVKLLLEAWSMSFDYLSTWVQVLSDIGGLGSLASKGCLGVGGTPGPSVPGMGWGSTGKDSAGLSPDLRCVFPQFPPDLAPAEKGDSPYL